MKLEITKEKVLEAASKCSQAKETLKTLFPEVFGENMVVVTDDDCGWPGLKLVGGGKYLLWHIPNTNYIRLDTTRFDWIIEGEKLIPTKK